MTPAAATEAVAGGRRNASCGQLRRAAAGVAALMAGFGVLVASGGGLDTVAFGIVLAPVLGAGYAFFVDRLHRLDRRLDEAAVIDDASLDQPGRTVVAALLRTWLLFGVWVGGAALLGAERSTLAGIGTIAMAVGLSQLAGSVLIRRWERRHGERVVVVEGELQRVALSR